MLSRATVLDANRSVLSDVTMNLQIWCFIVCPVCLSVTFSMTLLLHLWEHGQLSHACQDHSFPLNRSVTNICVTFFFFLAILSFFTFSVSKSIWSTNHRGVTIINAFISWSREKYLVKWLLSVIFQGRLSTTFKLHCYSFVICTHPFTI